MELDMKKNISSTDKISKQTLHEILLDIKYRLDHLEDIEADNRSLIVKLIKQSNSIVKFLAQIDVEPINDEVYKAELPAVKENKILADTFVSLMRNEETNLTQQLFSAFKQIK